MCGEGVGVNMLESDMDSFTSPTHLTGIKGGVQVRSPTEAKLSH